MTSNQSIKFNNYIHTYIYIQIHTDIYIYIYRLQNTEIKQNKLHLMFSAYERNIFNGSIPLNLCNLPHLQVLRLLSKPNFSSHDYSTSFSSKCFIFRNKFWSLYIHYGFGVNVMTKKYVDGIHLMLKEMRQST